MLRVPLVASLVELAPGPRSVSSWSSLSLPNRSSAQLLTDLEDVEKVSQALQEQGHGAGRRQAAAPPAASRPPYRWHPGYGLWLLAALSSSPSPNEGLAPTPRPRPRPPIGRCRRQPSSLGLSLVRSVRRCALGVDWLNTTRGWTSASPSINLELVELIEQSMRVRRVRRTEQRAPLGGGQGRADAGPTPAVRATARLGRCSSAGRRREDRPQSAVSTQSARRAKLEQASPATLKQAVAPADGPGSCRFEH
jgi:hypothetical protein